MLLKAHELWDVIEEDTPADDGDEDEHKIWKKRDQLALSSIALSLKPSEQEQIYNCKTAKSAWEHLKEVYEGKGTHRVLSLLKSLSTSKLEGVTTMKDYIRGVRQTADELAEIEVKLDKIAVMGFMLNGLPDSYRYLVVNLESQIKKISYEELSARLLDEEKRIGGVEESKEDANGYLSISRADAMRKQKADAKGPGPRLSFRNRKVECEYCGKIGHSEDRCYSNPDNTCCEYCGRFGHDEDGCHTKRFQERKGASRFGGLAYTFGSVGA